MRILYLLARQFKLLMEVRICRDAGMISRRSRRRQAFILLLQASINSAAQTEELRSIMEEAANTEEMVKTGRLNDRMSVELSL